MHCKGECTNGNATSDRSEIRGIVLNKYFKKSNTAIEIFVAQWHHWSVSIWSGSVNTKTGIRKRARLAISATTTTNIPNSIFWKWTFEIQNYKNIYFVYLQSPHIFFQLYSQAQRVFVVGWSFYCIRYFSHSSSISFEQKLKNLEDV